LTGAGLGRPPWRDELVDESEMTSDDRFLRGLVGHLAQQRTDLQSLSGVAAALRPRAPAAAAATTSACVPARLRALRLRLQCRRVGAQVLVEFPDACQRLRILIRLRRCRWGGHGRLG